MESIRFEVVKKIADINFKIKNLKSISKLDSNSPPSVFIGSKLKYPLVNVGILSPLERDEDVGLYDNAKYWAENNFQINDVIGLREGLMNSRFLSKVYDSRSNYKFLQIAQEIAIASKPVDVEIELKNNFKFKRKRDKILTPHGMRASLKKAKITSNTKISQKLDRVMSDEIKASEGIDFLYKNNFDEYNLSKILSVGVLGLKKNKRLVPTRWSITATDDIIGKKLLMNIKNYKWIENYELFFGEFMGNCYLIMFFPNVWNFELFELYLPGSSWNPSKEIKASTDFEDYWGRKNYAFDTAGGYYATRLRVLEHLNKIKRQASVLVIRIETPSYWASLGVWVVRESVKKALNNRLINFESSDELVKSAQQIGKIKFNFDSSQIFKRSKLLSSIKTQKSLLNWF
ncbi:MAG: hypothetical protein KKF68_03630 [Nanoarchaeota archaeon]|nr:hypothetical protein [Nanoarchaeota archaeon]